jgi:hypothetical protein
VGASLAPVKIAYIISLTRNLVVYANAFYGVSGAFVRQR